VPSSPRGGPARRVKSMRARATAVFSGVLLALGVALIVETALLGGGFGFLLGALFVLAGGLRLYLSVK
jgi:nitrate reductase NapE component